MHHTGITTNYKGTNNLKEVEVEEVEVVAAHISYVFKALLLGFIRIQNKGRQIVTNTKLRDS